MVRTSSTLQDDGELLRSWSAHKGQRGPFSLEGMLVEELDPAQSDSTGSCVKSVGHS